MITWFVVAAILMQCYKHDYQNHHFPCRLLPWSSLVPLSCVTVCGQFISHDSAMMQSEFVSHNNVPVPSQFISHGSLKMHLGFISHGNAVKGQIPVNSQGWKTKGAPLTSFIPCFHSSFLFILLTSFIPCFHSSFHFIPFTSFIPCFHSYHQDTSPGLFATFLSRKIEESRLVALASLRPNKAKPLHFPQQCGCAIPSYRDHFLPAFLTL